MFVPLSDLSVQGFLWNPAPSLPVPKNFSVLMESTFRKESLFLLMLFHAILLLLFSGVVFAQDPKPQNQADKQALLAIKSRITDKSSSVLASWNASIHFCGWIGVKCGRRHQRVTTLDLRGLGLAGIISPQIGNLTFLRHLNLADNSFRGSIPPEVEKLFRLQYLNMSNNFLGGGIPVGLSNCSTLLTLDLSSNRLAQEVPSELGLLSQLLVFSLGRNSLTGRFPASLGNLTSLQLLDFIYNFLDGEIPDTVAKMSRLTFFRIALNNFTGVFPPSIYNLSSLEVLSMTSNNFSGNLRTDFGTLLPSLQILYMGINHFTGAVPPSLSNASGLWHFDIPTNNLTGTIPLSFGKLQNLQRLGVGTNQLGNHSEGDLDFLGALANCSQLQYLSVGYNRLGGKLPLSMSNLSTQLAEISLGGNLITGEIPREISNLIGLQTINLGESLLTGSIPDSIGRLSNLGKLLLHYNKLSGEIPSSLGNVTKLTYLYLLNTPSLGNCVSLLDVELGTNKLNGTIPIELMGLPSLFILNVSFNSLVGRLSEEVGNLKFLIALDVSYNKLSGQIPQTLRHCLGMQYLLMQRNFFEGTIPDLSGLTGLKYLDLSSNNLSGPIPEYLGNFSSFLNLNLSFDNFEGEVPLEGVFQNISAVNVSGNTRLCGGIPELKLPPCAVKGFKTPKKHLPVRTKALIGTITGLVASLALFLAMFFLYRSRKKKPALPLPSSYEPSYQKVSYEELLNATNGFSLSNLVGSGNFGSVYKGVLGPGSKTVAVKVLNLQRRGASKSFIAECEALKNIRHRNLVKLVTACSSADFEGNEFRALVYEFMPNGSLEMWMHPEDGVELYRKLNLAERLNVAIDTASVLVYLHDYCHNPIVHCDLKPSNVLLDEDLTAHVSDFGLARLISKFGRESFLNQFSSAGIKGTIGYAPPEYGMGGQPSTTGDVYSFGILLLEMFTGKRPTDKHFMDDSNLHNFVKLALPDRLLEITDQAILHDIEAMSLDNHHTDNSGVIKCLTLLFSIGLRCSEDSPRNRTDMATVVKQLNSIRDGFFTPKHHDKEITGQWSF